MMENKMKNEWGAHILSWIERFVAQIPHLQKVTRQKYRRILLTFVAYVERISGKKKCLPIRIERKIIAGFLKEMRAHYSLYTVLSRVGIIDNFLSFLRKSGGLQKNPLTCLQKQFPSKGLKGIILALTGPSPQKSLRALKVPPEFASPLGANMKQFIALHQTQGRIYQSEVHIFRRFDRFLRSYSDPPRQLSDSILQRWLGLFSRAHSGHRYKIFKVIRRFCLYLRRLDPEAYVPDSSLGPSPPPPFFPHIYSRSELVALLKAARQLKPSGYSPLRPQTLYLLILLLYTTGMRLGEALKLQLADIDWKNRALHLRETKFFKSRLVPLSPSMMKEVEVYLQLRQRSGAPTNPQSFLFQNPHHKGPYSNSAIGEPFRRMVKRLGLPPTQGHSGPRLHDLRHTFAVHRLEDWYRRGVDVQSKLGLLSTYLGHVGIASTQRYLTMTTELLQQASQRFNQYFTSLNKEEKRNEN